jgi:hypothetical protein
MTTVTNRKSTFDSNANPDIDARAIATDGTLSGTISQVVGISFNDSGTETLVNTANPLPVTGSITLTAPDNATSTALEASRIAKASAGTLFTISGFNTLSTDQFIQVFDSSTLPANGVVPAIVFIAFGNSNFGYTGGIRGRAFTSGIVVCNSTTAATKTIGAANCLFDIQYS